tara:strand:+ start:13 stop:546 length:534 start_codon:yes stop_codon:yes gene_type:complete
MKYLKHKPGSIEEIVSKLRPEDSEYQAKFKKELDKAGKGIGAMSPKEKKDFFNKIDKMHKAKSEMTDAQKKLPPALQKAIKDKEQKEDLDKGDEKTIKPIIKQLKKSVVAHDKQAKSLEKDISDEKATKTVKEMMKRKKDDTSTMADTEKEKNKKSTTLVGSKKTPVDTKPEIEYKN